MQYSLEQERVATDNNANTYLDDNGVLVFDANSAYNELAPYLNVYESPNKAVRQYLLDNYRGKLINIGNLYDAKFSSKSAGEYSYPSNRRQKQEIKNAKQTISVDLGDIALNATYLDTKENNNPKKPADYYDYFKVSFGKDNGEKTDYYDGILNVEVANNIPTFYDITQIKKRSTTGEGFYAHRGASSINNISNNGKNVKNSLGLTNEDLRNPDLLAIHNISADNLRKALDLGGLAVPSNVVTPLVISFFKEMKTEEEILKAQELKV